MPDNNIRKDFQNIPASLIFKSLKANPNPDPKISLNPKPLILNPKH